MSGMKEIKLDKITLNMGAGESGGKLEKCKTMLETISGKKVVTTITHGRTTFGMAKHRPIGVKITLRGAEAEELLKKLLQGVENRLSPKQFDSSGNVSFGIHEYINIPGIRYDPDVGIVGLDIAVTLTRPGYRVKKRRIKPAKVGSSHRITAEEAMEFMKSRFNVNVTEKKE